MIPAIPLPLGVGLSILATPILTALAFLFGYYITRPLTFLVPRVTDYGRHCLCMALGLLTATLACFACLCLICSIGGIL